MSVSSTLSFRDALSDTLHVHMTCRSSLTLVPTTLPTSSNHYGHLFSNPRTTGRHYVSIGVLGGGSPPLLLYTVTVKPFALTLDVCCSLLTLYLYCITLDSQCQVIFRRCGTFYDLLNRNLWCLTTSPENKRSMCSACHCYPRSSPIRPPPLA